jgi:protein-S-isoprenylcysteine O-methyltransferase Ste14
LATGMPASKQRSASPAARGEAETPGGRGGGRSPSPALIKARHRRYKEVGGTAPWLPDLQRACELAAVVFLLLPGLFMNSFAETVWGQAALQRFCVLMTGACVLGRFLFAVPLPKCSITVTQDKNDRLVAHEHESASQLENALELAMPEVSGDKDNSAYYVNPPGKGVKGLWHQPEANQPPLFVPCAELLADGADRYTIPADEVKQSQTALFATNPSVQKSNIESKLKKQWSTAATRVEQIVFAIYGLLGFSVLRPSNGFNFLSILALLLAGALAVGLHVVGLGLNDHPVDANVGGVAIKLPAALWKRDLNARKSVRRQPLGDARLTSFVHPLPLTLL